MVVPLGESQRKMVWFGRWRMSMGMAATALALVFLVWGSNLMHLPQGNYARDLTLENQDTESLVTEVDMLVETIVPQVYLEICAESELYFNDEFIEFMVPIVEDDPLLLISREKGVQSC